ncbi:MAG: hypothetical protein H0U70_05420 [Tatlockia sp.]|nr:hypothetical protein [Tatlockia sp.]
MRYLFFLSTLFIVACSPQNEHYYQTHPQALQEALKNCPDRKPSQMSCEQLKALAVKTNELAYQLQASPQLFGKKILALQESIAAQKNELAAHSSQPELKASLENNKQLLTQYLAIARWLESPES